MKLKITLEGNQIRTWDRVSKIEYDYKYKYLDFYSHKVISHIPKEMITKIELEIEDES